MKEILKYEYHRHRNQIYNYNAGFFAEQDSKLKDKIIEAFEGGNVLLSVIEKDLNGYLVFLCDKKVYDIEAKKAADLIVLAIAEIQKKNGRKDLIDGLISEVNKACDVGSVINDHYNDDEYNEEKHQPKRWCALM